MKSIASPTELQQVEEEARRRQAALVRTRLLSRRGVISGAAALAAGGVLAACFGGAQSSPAASSRVSKDPLALPDSQKPYPLLDQYNWRRVKWGGAPYVGGTLNISATPPADYDLMTTQSTFYPSFMNGLFYPGMHAGNDLDRAPTESDLAQTSEHSADYTSWVFTLPKNAFFHDIAPVNGAQMTSRDVKFSFDRYKDTSIWNQQIDDVDHIETPDDFTVKFVMKKPSPRFPNTLALPYYQIFNQKHFENQEVFKRQVIGTGAFVLKDSKYQVSLHSERNQKYWGTSTWLTNKPDVRLPFADNFNATYYSDQASTTAALRGGSLDAGSPTGILPDGVDALLKTNPNLQVVANSDWAVSAVRVWFNWKNPTFRDVRVRRALSMALDRENIVKVAYGGAGVPAASPVPHDQMGLDGPPTLDMMGPYFKYDPAGAKQLLADAGYGNGLKITAIQSTTGLAPWMTLVQKYWKDVGVDLQINTVTALQHLTALRNKDFDMTMAGNSVIGFDVDAVMRPMFYPGAGSNFYSIDDPELTKVLDQVHASINPDEWPKLAKQVFDVVNKNIPVLFVCGAHNWMISQPWVHTIVHSYYLAMSNYGSTNYRNVWVDDTAPAGRGGKAVAT